MEKINANSVFNKYANLYHFEEVSSEYLIDQEDFKQAMKDFAEKVLELAAENAVTHEIETGIGCFSEIDKQSIKSVINQIDF